MQREMIKISHVTTKQAGISVLHDINLTIKEKETWAVVGDSGSGKTTLARALTGSIFYTGTIEFNFNGAIEVVEQQHRFKTLSNTNDFYYQQRFQSQDAEDSLTIRQELKPFFEELPDKTTSTLHLLKLDTLLDEPMIQLSNGENKRLQIARALLRNPRVLILDNPFVGLDAEGRALLHAIINEIAATDIHLVLITSHHEIPVGISHIAVLDKGELAFSGGKAEYDNWQNVHFKKRVAINDRLLDSLSTYSPHPVFEYAIKMKDVTIRYGDRVILDNVNWEVKKGERWSLSGPNGAGKSTLLSLVNADNPQAYANSIWLFDKRRGRGESIWDIKKNIGYVSPEMHLHFPYVSTCFEVVASGLFDTVGLFRQLTEEQEKQVMQWIGLLELGGIAAKPLHQLSLGHQRMALLARALVKNPALLILDEPGQGLDDLQVEFFNRIVDRICTRFGTTLVYVSHYRAQLPGVIGRNLQLEGGKIVLNEEIPRSPGE